MRSRRDELLRGAGNTVACTRTPLDQSESQSEVPPSFLIRYLEVAESNVMPLDTKMLA